MIKLINGHAYECYWQGRIVYYIDFKPYYTAVDAAKALEMAEEEFKKIED